MSNIQNEGKNFKHFDEIRFSRNMGEFACKDMCLFTQDYAVVTFHKNRKTDKKLS